MKKEIATTGTILITIETMSNLSTIIGFALSEQAIKNIHIFENIFKATGIPLAIMGLTIYFVSRIEKIETEHKKKILALKKYQEKTLEAFGVNTKSNLDQIYSEIDNTKDSIIKFSEHVSQISFKNGIPINSVGNHKIENASVNAYFDLITNDLEKSENELKKAFKDWEN